MRVGDFDPWVGKIPWRKEWQPTLVFLPGESLGQRALAGVAKSQTELKQLSAYTCMPARLDEAQAGIKIARRTINNLRYADDTSLMAESKEELKSLLMT